MKKVTKRPAEVEMKREYDFSKGVRGKYAKRYAEGTDFLERIARARDAIRRGKGVRLEDVR